ncbi:monofunctional biosynthetic peptidoglycan transglycosylase [Gemmatimonadota bacterium]
MTSNPRKGHGRRRKLIALLVLTILIAAGILRWYHLPWDFSEWREGPPPETWSTWTRYEQILAGEPDRPGIDYTYVPLDEISLNLQVAVIVSEDISFFFHQGIDWTAVREALGEWLRGEGLRGASTITQQLAKNLFLSDKRSFTRKFREARMARALEQQLGKQRILELYLNVIEFGDGILGVKAAALHYYGASALGLNRDRAAGLAAAIPSPIRHNPDTRTRAWDNRKETIRGRMDQADWLRRRLGNNRDPG